ncbi:defensin-like protein 183 [Senna tora]|uniref:Defensin-like protein n=1 Tax=Senna tora TaxID=362788 RepID=A0A834X4B4_9FABA|nr:defensin-like protein 183 [Senna tora]
MTVEIVDGSECSQALGECGSEGECDNLCKAEYEGEGSCVMNSCTCNYKCGPSVGPKEIKRDCNAGLGYCGGKCWDECCNSGCASKYNEGIGFCHDYTVGIERVEGNACSEAMGQCGPAGDCDQRCKAQHPGGEGSCDLNLCTCYYSCGPPPSPPGPERKCSGAAGLCTIECGSECCNSECARKYNEGIGFCQLTVGIERVEGDACSEAMGQCGPLGECDQRCKAQHPGGDGSCEMNLCTCYYSCEPERKCTAASGLCTAQCGNDCCNSECARKYKEGVGLCDNSAVTYSMPGLVGMGDSRDRGCPAPALQYSQFDSLFPKSIRG